MIDFQDRFGRLPRPRGRAFEPTPQDQVDGYRLVQALSGELAMIAGFCWARFRQLADRPRLFRLGAIPPLITSVLFTGLLVR